MELQDITKEAITVREDATFKEAIALMIDKKTNTLIAVDADGIFTGEVNVFDLLDAIVPDYLDGDSIAANFATEDMFDKAVVDATDNLVKDFMTVGAEPIHQNDGLMNVAAHAIANQRAHMPVVDDARKPIGMISRRGIKHILGHALGIEDSA